MVTIKTINKCFKEVKRLTGDLLPDEQINQILDEAKIKIEENKFQDLESKTDKILAEEIADKLEYDQIFKKRNLAENNMKALDTYQKVIDAVDLSEGRINPIEAVSAILVGMQKFSKITRDSIGGKQEALEDVLITKLIRNINNISDNAFKDFADGKMDVEIMNEMLGIPTGIKDAKNLAKVLKEFQSDLRLRLNDLGANIGELDDWITKMSHNTEKMAIADIGSRLITDNRYAWREYIKSRLDLKRTFRNVNDPVKIDEILDSIFDSLMSGDHTKYSGADSIYGTKNVTNRLNAARVLHFKNAQARQEYNIKFGEPSLKEGIFSVLATSSRNIALMQELGTNPRNTLDKVLSLLKKNIKNQTQKWFHN